MRAVLRPVLAARRRARPTARVSFEGAVFFLDLLMNFVQLPQVYGRNYHTLSIRQLKDDKRFGSYSSFGQNGE
jgi:hypothetical protein